MEAIDGLLRTVADASVGNRNNALYWAARTAAEEGNLDQIADALIAAAVSAGENESKARATVASARRAVA